MKTFSKRKMGCLITYLLKWATLFRGESPKGDKIGGSLKTDRAAAMQKPPLHEKKISNINEIDK